MNILFKIVFSIFISIGIIGFIGGILISIEWINYNKELPLSHIESIQIDEDENIYLGLQFYGYVQKYSSTGEFLGNWRVNRAYGGSIVLEILESKLHVTSAKGRSIEIFDKNGKIIETILNSISYDPLKKLTRIEHRNGNIYELQGWLDTKIIQRDSSEKTRVIVEMNWLHKLLRAPFPAMLIFMVGTIGLNLLKKKKTLKI